MAPRPKPAIRGWCPGAWRPMRAGDGLLVRVRPRAGRLTSSQATGIAALASHHGNGLIDLTSRANLQLRGIAEASFPRVIDGLRDLELLDRDPDAEARRNIVVTPFWQAGDGTIELAEALAEALATEDAPELPGKFGFAVDCGDVAVLRATSATIRIERGVHGLVVRADGFASRASVSADQAVRFAMELAGRSVDRRPALPEGRDMPPLPALPTRPGPMPQGFLAGIEFGQLRAETLAALAALGPLRITPWRMVLIEGLAEFAGLAGVIHRADDPLLRVVACVGAPSCLQGIAATRPLARALAPQVAMGELLHVSGCTKGCAHHANATTLVATRDGFDLVRDGTAASAPAVRSLSAEAARHLLERTADALPV